MTGQTRRTLTDSSDPPRHAPEDALGCQPRSMPTGGSDRTPMLKVRHTQAAQPAPALGVLASVVSYVFESGPDHRAGRTDRNPKTPVPNRAAPTLFCSILGELPRKVSRDAANRGRDMAEASPLPCHHADCSANLAERSFETETAGNGHRLQRRDQAPTSRSLAVGPKLQTRAPYPQADSRRVRSRGSSPSRESPLCAWGPCRAPTGAGIKTPRDRGVLALLGV